MPEREPGELARNMFELISGNPLPSDLLERARRRNPHVEVTIEEIADRDGKRRLALVVGTGRGKTTWHRDGDDRWHDVFERAGLMR